MTLFLSRDWKASGSELSFVTRAVAGAASRSGPVTVVLPSPVGPTEADGAFDLFGTGLGDEESWPSPHAAAWPTDLPAATTIIVDEPDHATLALLNVHARDYTVHAISPADGDQGPISSLQFADSSETGGPDFIGLHVPINPLAATHRHNGLGFTGYLLVLSDRVGAPDVNPPTPLVAWLTARFPTLDIVVVEDATAAVWRGRALRGKIAVYTRTDLWRLLAHARVTIDLAPGRIVARECVESLRFGTPIIVPAQSAAQPHANAGGGMTFADVPELLACVERLSDEMTHAAMSTQGQRYADAHYGNQKFFVDSVAHALGAPPVLQSSDVRGGQAKEIDSWANERLGL
jgi:hypothetical protein